MGAGKLGHRSRGGAKEHRLTRPNARLNSKGPWMNFVFGGGE